MAQACCYSEADHHQHEGLINTTRVLLVELLLWQAQPDFQNEARMHSIREARSILARMLHRSSVLKFILGRILEGLYADACQHVCEQKKLAGDYFPARCPYALNDILSPIFWPKLP